MKNLKLVALILFAVLISSQAFADVLVIKRYQQTVGVSLEDDLLVYHSVKIPEDGNVGFILVLNNNKLRCVNQKANNQIVCNQLNQNNTQTDFYGTYKKGDKVFDLKQRPKRRVVVEMLMLAGFNANTF